MIPRDIEPVYNAAEVDKLIEAKDAEIHRLKRDLVDAVQNIQAHSMIVDASEKDAEIERLKGLVKYHCEQQMEGWKKERVYKALITELCDALAESASHDKDWARQSNYLEIAQRAREATR